MMNRGVGFRPPCMKVFVPISEGFHARQEQRRNSVLATIIGPARLGPCPQDTIASDLATRYGGFDNDFMAAKYRARDFILFLPAWVRSEVLVSREYIRLPHCKLRCFPWNPYDGAPRSWLAFKAWVTIVNLPYECWYEARVAAIVSYFRRYLLADDATANMRDLTGFRCQIAVDSPADIPESLAISLGEIIVTVNVRLEGTSPFGGDDHGTPFSEGTAAKVGVRRTPSAAPWRGGFLFLAAMMRGATVGPERRSARTSPGTPQQYATAVARSAGTPAILALGGVLWLLSGR